MTKDEQHNLRDYFAAHALPVAMTQAAAGVPEYVLTALFGKHAGGITREQIAAALAYLMADEMIARRERVSGTRP